METEGQAIGTVIGTVPDGETLAGWEIVSTGDGGAITMKSGSCWGRWAGSAVDTDTGWNAVTARLWARMSDAEVLAKLVETAREFCAAKVAGARMRAIGAQAAYEVVCAEAGKRGIA